jgi:hypothetical protein
MCRFSKDEALGAAHAALDHARDDAAAAMVAAAAADAARDDAAASTLADTEARLVAGRRTWRSWRRAEALEATVKVITLELADARGEMVASRNASAAALADARKGQREDHREFAVVLGDAQAAADAALAGRCRSELAHSISGV